VGFKAPQKEFAAKVAGIVAIRDIAKGEPITWSYVGMAPRFSERTMRQGHMPFTSTIFLPAPMACAASKCQIPSVSKLSATIDSGRIGKLDSVQAHVTLIDFMH